MENEIIDTRRITAEDSKTTQESVDSVTEPKYTPFSPIMDRVQVKVIEEMVKDEQGVLMPPKYRQHSNMGVVIAIGQWVILGGKQIPLGEVIQPGDKVLFGEYNCEKFDGVDGEEYELIRVQDIRGVWRLIQNAWVSIPTVNIPAVVVGSLSTSSILPCTENVPYSFDPKGFTGVSHG